MKNLLRGLLLAPLSLIPAGFTPTDSSADTLARLVPQEAVAYFQFQNLQEGYAQLDPYLAKTLGDQAGEKLKNFLITTVTDGLTAPPENVAKEMIRILPKLDSLHLAIFELSEDRFEWIILCGLSPGAEWQPLFDAVIKTGDFHKPVEEFEKTNLYQFRLTRAPCWLASTGNVSILSSNPRWIKQALTRRAGKSRDPSILDNDTFKTAREGIAQDAFSVAGFFDLGKYFDQFTRDMRYHDRLGFDEWDAVLNMTGLKAATFQMSMRDGAGILKGAVTAGPDCLPFRWILNPPAEKKILHLVPEDSLFALSLSLKDVSASWQQLKKRILDNSENFESPYMKDFAKELLLIKEREHFDLDKFLGAFRSEAGLYFTMDDAGREPQFAMCFESQDPESITSMLAKVDRTAQESKDYRGHTIQYSPRSWFFQSAFSSIDPYVAYSLTGPAGIEKMIDAQEDKTSLAENPSFKKRYTRAGQKNSLMMGVNIKSILKLIEQNTHELPFKLAGKVQNPWDVFVAIDDGGTMKFEYHGAGAPLLAAIGVPVLFLTLEEELSRVRGRNVVDNEKLITKDPKKNTDTPLPEKDDELKRLVSQLTDDLGSDRLDTREEATRKLITLGNHARARPFVVEALKTALKSKDPEVTARAMTIRLEIQDFSHMTEQEIRSQIQSLLDKMTIQTIENFSPTYKPDLSQWGIDEHDLVLLESDAGQTHLSKMILDGQASERITLSAALLLSWTEHVSPETLPNILKAYDRYEHESHRNLSTALTYILLKYDHPDAQKRLITALQTMEFSYYALPDEIVKNLNRSHIPLLLPMLKQPAPRSRFTGGYILDKLTDRAVRYNAFWDKDRREAAAAVYQKWWEANKEPAKRETGK